MCIWISIFTFKARITFFFADKPMHTAKKIQIRILDLQLNVLETICCLWNARDKGNAIQVLAAKETKF